MNWERIIVNALEAGLGLQTVVFALAAIGLNVHFGYTGLLNFGQSAFLAVAAYGLAVTRRDLRPAAVAGHRRRARGSACCSRCCSASRPCGSAPTTSRSSTIAAAEIVRLIARSVTFEDTLGGSDGRQDFSGDFYALNPYPERQLRHRVLRLQRARSCGCSPSAGSWSACPAWSSSC